MGHSVTYCSICTYTVNGGHSAGEHSAGEHSAGEHSAGGHSAVCIALQWCIVGVNTMQVFSLLFLFTWCRNEGYLCCYQCAAISNNVH